MLCFSGISRRRQAGPGTLSGWLAGWLAGLLVPSFPRPSYRLVSGWRSREPRLPVLPVLDRGATYFEGRRLSSRESSENPPSCSSSRPLRQAGRQTSGQASERASEGTNERASKLCQVAGKIAKLIFSASTAHDIVEPNRALEMSPARVSGVVSIFVPEQEAFAAGALTPTRTTRDEPYRSGILRIGHRKKVGTTGLWKNLI